MKETEKKNQTILNYKKAKGSIEKILQMIENNDYCIDIMQQNLAVIGLLKSAQQQLMENHLGSCFKTVMEKGTESRKKQIIAEILKVNSLYQK